MSEQERVRGMQLAFLKTQIRLSVSFDGGDVGCGEDFYTVHANTSDGRSFLLEGFECTGVSHTTNWLAGVVLGVMKTVGIERFIASLSDGPPQTRGCRRRITEEAPTVLDMADPCHHMSLAVKDISQIPYFIPPIKVMRGTVRHFSQSKDSKNALKQLRSVDGIRGLETIGKTRFATLPWSSISLRANLNLKYNSSFIKDTPKTLDFEMKLNQYIAVTEGLARAIQCLEAAACNPADIYLIWLAVTAHIRAALTSSLLPESVCDEIRGVINYRWKEFFVTNPGHGTYLAAFYLNPKYVNSSIFKRPNPLASATITIPGKNKAPEPPIGVKNAKTFFTVAQYLFDQAVIEIEHGIDPTLMAYRKKKTAFSGKFKQQFAAYAQGEFPFNSPLGSMRPIDWWCALERSEHGGIIVSLALKLYSVVPHSMADERTVSVITWMNPALRNHEKVNTIFSFAQIRQWYRDQAKQKALADGTAKVRPAARPHPEVKFYNIEREIHSVDDQDELMDLDLDDIESDDESDEISVGVVEEAKKDWLDDSREVLPSSDTLFLEAGEVDLDSALLQDILAEWPGAAMQRSTTSVDDESEGMEDGDEEEDANATFTLGSW
ncbi:ribonuclease H-like domain-containing protein [Mycena maculata]|uniref:Ribonuclease H-like domain-containing protein n=1 Tax=Mycena maculata TaxID=230809 RepID=A0AAD7NG60_9AGAR|nr:ribonuclease H-like domain-containing protein [Mycena maculata]